MPEELKNHVDRVVEAIEHLRPERRLTAGQRRIQSDHELLEREVFADPTAPRRPTTPYWRTGRVTVTSVSGEIEHGGTVIIRGDELDHVARVEVDGWHVDPAPDWSSDRLTVVVPDEAVGIAELTIVSVSGRQLGPYFVRITAPPEDDGHVAAD